jgi:chromosome segregation ATPase
MSYYRKIQKSHAHHRIPIRKFKQLRSNTDLLNINTPSNSSSTVNIIQNPYFTNKEITEEKQHFLDQVKQVRDRITFIEHSIESKQYSDMKERSQSNHKSSTIELKTLLNSHIEELESKFNKEVETLKLKQKEYEQMMEELNHSVQLTSDSTVQSSQYVTDLQNLKNQIEELNQSVQLTSDSTVQSSQYVTDLQKIKDQIEELNKSVQFTSGSTVQSSQYVTDLQKIKDQIEELNKSVQFTSGSTVQSSQYVIDLQNLKNQIEESKTKTNQTVELFEHNYEEKLKEQSVLLKQEILSHHSYVEVLQKELQSHIQQLKDELNLKTHKLSELENKILQGFQGMKLQSSDWSQNFDSLTKDQKELNDICKQLQDLFTSYISRHDKTHEEIQKQHEKSIGILQTSIDEKQKQMESLHDQLLVLCQNISTQNEKVDSKQIILTEEIQQIKNQHDQLAKELQMETQKKIQEHKSYISQLESKLSILNQQFIDQLGQLKQQMADSRANTENENTRISSRIDQVMGKVDSQSLNMENMKVENKSDIQNVHQIVDNIKKDIVGNFQEHQKQLTNHLEQITSLSQTLKLSIDDRTKMSLQTETLSQAYEQLEKEHQVIIQNMQSQYEVLQGKYQQLHEIMLSNVAETDQGNEYIRNLIQLHQQKEQDYKNTLQNYEKQHQQFKKALQERDGQLKMLETQIKHQIDEVENKLMNSEKESTDSTRFARTYELAKPKHINIKKDK